VELSHARRLEFADSFKEQDMAEERYLEDFAVGQTFRSGSVSVTSVEIKAFASQFDPQPFHLDETAAAATFFGGLVASGWHTAALTMRLIVESELKIAGGSIGAGAEELKWPRPVRPGDTLHALSEVLDIRPSKSRPDQGIIKMRTVTYNQNDQPVMIFVANMLVPRRPG
jgi:acyl dehydratase